MTKLDWKVSGLGGWEARSGGVFLHVFKRGRTLWWMSVMFTPRHDRGASWARLTDDGNSKHVDLADAMVECEQLAASAIREEFGGLL